MPSTQVSATGAFVCWTLAAWTDHKILTDQLSAIGLGGYVPKPPSPQVALHEALKEICASSDRLVRPLSEAAAYCVVKEKKVGRRNEYETERTARIDPDVKDRVSLLFNPYDDVAKEVHKTFDAMQGRVASSALSTSLVAIVKRLHGTAIRPTGGIYWVPNPELFEPIAKAVEASGLTGHHIVYIVGLHVNAQAVRLVKHAIEAEILAESQRLHEEISQADLGKKALENRCDYLSEMEKKVIEYEAILGESLTHLKDSLKTVQTAIGMGEFLNLASDEAAA